MPAGEGGGQSYYRFGFDVPLLVPPRWPSGKASASRAEGPGFESRLRRDFFGVESYL